MSNLREEPELPDALTDLHYVLRRAEEVSAIAPEAVRLVQEGQFQNAASLLTDAMQQHPDVAALCILRAFCWSQMEQYPCSRSRKPEIDRDLTRVLELEPDNIMVLRARCPTIGTTARYRRHIGDLTRLMELDPEHWDIYMTSRAYRYHWVGDDRAAQTDLDELVRRGAKRTVDLQYLLEEQTKWDGKLLLSPLERDVFAGLAKRNHTTLEAICRTCRRTDTIYTFHYYADGHRPPLTDISPLARLQGLTRVEIHQCDIRDLSPLADIPTLEQIMISGGSELLPCDFTSLKELRNLYLRYDRCTIPKVSGLPNLKTVGLRQITSLEGLRGLENLTHLDVSSNYALNDLSPLADCPGLLLLSAVDTGICDLTPLAGHPNLKEITLSDAPVTDVSPLATIPTLERIWLYGTPVEEISCLAALPLLNDLNLYKTRVTDLSAFQGREHILGIERKKLGIKKAGKSAREMKTAIAAIREQLDQLSVKLRPPLSQDAVNAFQEKTGVTLPKEYVAFLTQIGDGFEVRFDSFNYYFPPLSEVQFDAARVNKRFSHREAWIWEDDDNATDQKITAAIQNGQIELVDCGCGRSFHLIVCGAARGEVWDVADVGIGPYGNGLDFLDWMKDFLEGKVI